MSALWRSGRRGPRAARLLAATLLAVLLAAVFGPGTAVGQGAPSVTGATVTSTPASGDTYGLGETIRVTLTFSEAVTVSGTPRLKIDMDPADWGEKWAAYEGGTGTANLTFVHTVVEPNYSTGGIAVLENSLQLNGGTIRSASSGAEAALAHTGRDHDPDHKVDWQRTAALLPRSEPVRPRSDVVGDAVADAPAISSATATLTTVTVAWNAPSSDGGAAITAYDLRHIRSDAGDKSDGQWTEQHDIWETGGGALSYTKTGLTPSTGYDFQVRAVNANGDGSWSATRTATTGTPAIAGTAAISYPENAATRVGTFTVTGADEEVDDVTWAISGTDASHFDIAHPKGALRLIDTSDTATGLKRPKQPDFESPDDGGADGSYSITLTATVGGVAKTLAVTVTLTDADEPGGIVLSPVRPRVGTALTATLSDPDTVSGATTWAWQRSSGRNSWSTIAGATGASYTPVAADSGQYLRARATYTDGHGGGKTAEATAHHVVIAHVLTGLSATTTDSTLALTPAFEADVLHYKVSCGDTDTMTVTPTADPGVRLAVNGTQTASGSALAVSVTKHSDVVIRATGADGGYTDYVVHCVQDWLATMQAIDRDAGDVTESLIAFPLGDYLAVIDHHGVPRYRRDGTTQGTAPRFWFRHYRVGSSGEYRWHYTIRPPGGCASHYILDEDFAQITRVYSREPLKCTGIHDFRILDNGRYLLMSYEPHINRDISHVTLHPSLLADGEHAGRVRKRHNNSQDSEYWRDTQFTASEYLSDSAFQIITPTWSPTLTWNSWGTMAYEDCVQHWWDEYAHVNSVQYFEGSVIGSYRGCAKVLSVNASTGRVEWRLGRSNLTDEEWAARNIGPAPLRIVGDPEGEFCGQHAAEMRPDGQDGRLTLYDNGEECLIDLETGDTKRTSDEYARAVEYALDLDNGEAVFLRDHSLHGGKDRAGTRGGQVDVLDNGDWLIGWGRERQPHHQATKLSPDEAITQVDPSTGVEKLSFKIPAGGTSTFQANVRPSAVPAYVLAPQPADLFAAAPESDRTSAFHKGAGDTAQVLLTFDRPVVDFAVDSPSFSVTGGTVTDVGAVVADGEPANAYLVTLDPAGAADIRLTVLAGRACASGGICTGGGTTLKRALTVVVPAAPQVSFQRAASSVREGGSVSVVVRLSRPHQIAGGVTIPVTFDASASSASQVDFAPDFATTQSVTFQPGETSKTLRIQAASDTLVEGPETIVLGFGTLPDAIGAGTISSTTVTVTDANTAAIAFSRFLGELAEDGSVDFTFEITNGVTFAEDATINLAVSGSAGAGDFTLVAGGSTLTSPYSVTLRAGESSTSFTVRATDDAVVENVDETVTISARLALTNASLGTRTVTIQPSDVLNVPDVTISAGSSVTEGDEASFTLARTGATTSALTVLVRVVATGVSLSGSAPSSVTFAADSSTAALSLPTRDDTVVRAGGGQVAAYLLGSSANPPIYLTTTANQASVTVDDNDVASFTVTASAEELTEGQSLTVTVDTGGVTFADAQEIELRLSGSATPAGDYTLPGGCTASPCVVTLQRGARTVRATFRTRYDGVTEGGESIFIDAYHDDGFIGSVSASLADGAARPPVVLPPGGFGGGGSSTPTPSEADFEWTVQDDIEELAAGNDRPTGAWSDGSTLWLANNADGSGDAIYAYDIASGERIEDREFALDARNGAPRGVAGAGGVLWVVDSGRDRLFAYDAESGERLPERDIELARGNRDARGAWTDGETIFVLNRNPSLYAYDPLSGDLLGVYALDPANGDPRGLWSDGVTVWVSDHGAKRLFAYRLPAPDADRPAGEPRPLERVRDEEFTHLTRASNLSPRGIWSDGAVMYVADANDGRVYSYNMPDAIDARLASLTLAGIEFGEFSPLRTEYEGGAETGVEETTVEAVPAQEGAQVAIEPPDADGDAREGYQVTLAGIRKITVTVTSSDGSRTRVYRVKLAGAEEPLAPQEHLEGQPAECLRGPVVAGGFSLMLAGRGGVDDLGGCAARGGVAALYALHEGEWVSYILAAPDFVNGPFRELFAEGLPPGTPLVARGVERTVPEADARLASLALHGVAFGAFSPGRTEYAGVADEGLEHATVEAVPAREGATVAIAPADADGDPFNGHQATLRAGAPVTVTVTSADGTRTVVYRVWIADAGAGEDAEAAAECLRGVTGPGFSLVVHEGGSVEQLAACARSLGVRALYALADGAYVSYLLGAPDFVNEAFGELFPHGLPPGTPLVAAGGN